MRHAQLRTEGFSAGEELARFAHAHPAAGAVASFVGRVRPTTNGGGQVHSLHLTYYEPLTLTGIETLMGDASERFDLDGLIVHHRTGYVKPGAAIVLVAAAAIHRRDAFDAVDFMMDHLKSAAWFWKREKRADGWHWIDPRPDDHAALERWHTG